MPDEPTKEATTEQCPECRNGWITGQDPFKCLRCGGTGRIHLPTPPEPQPSGAAMRVDKTGDAVVDGIMGAMSLLPRDRVARIAAELGKEWAINPVASACQHLSKTWDEKGNGKCDTCGATWVYELLLSEGGAGMRVDDARIEHYRRTSHSVFIVRLVDDLLADRAEMVKQRDRIVGIVQMIQPSGSPPPYGPEMFVQWIVRAAAEELARLRAENAALVAEMAGVREEAARNYRRYLEVAPAPVPATANDDERDSHL